MFCSVEAAGCDHEPYASQYLEILKVCIMNIYIKTFFVIFHGYILSVTLFAYSRTRLIVEDFGKTKGTGEMLQDKLRRYAETKENWVCII